MSAKNSAKDAIGRPAVADPVALDGIQPPPGCDGPTNVVWREYGRRSERMGTLGACFLIYTVGGALLALIRPELRHFDSTTITIDVFLFFAALFHYWVMTNPNGSPVYAAGDTWFLLVGRGYSRQKRNHPSSRSYAVLKSDELQRVSIVTRNRVGSISEQVRLVDSHHKYLQFEVTALQQCPPLAALVSAAMSARTDIQVGDGVRAALRTRSKPSGGGTTTVRPGFTW